MLQPLIQVGSTWTVEVLAPGVDSRIVTQCASIRIRNMSATLPLELAPANSAYRLAVAPGGVWGIDLTDVRDELQTVITAFTKNHDANVIIERIFKHVL